MKNSKKEKKTPQENGMSAWLDAYNDGVNYYAHGEYISSNEDKNLTRETPLHEQGESLKTAKSGSVAKTS